MADYDYIAHLARHDRSDSDTACGEPWQDWQAPADALHVIGRHPHPRPHIDTIRQCQACLRVPLLIERT